MKRTQGRRLIEILKRKPMTYMQLLMLGISTCPHKRIAESLRDGEVLIRVRNRRGLTVMRVYGT